MRNKKWNEHNKKREQGFSLALSFIALLRARIIWVPHPRRAFVFAARVG
jgi:hypothetical protein